MASSSRVTVSLPASVARDLRRASKLLGLSQSAVITTLVASDLRDIAKSRAGPGAPPSGRGKAGGRRRLRGASVVVVRETLAQALEEAAHQTQELPFGPVR